MVSPRVSQRRTSQVLQGKPDPSHPFPNFSWRERGRGDLRRQRQHFSHGMRGKGVGFGASI